MGDGGGLVVAGHMLAGLSLGQVGVGGVRMESVCDGGTKSEMSFRDGESLNLEIRRAGLAAGAGCAAAIGAGKCALT